MIRSLGLMAAVVTMFAVTFAGCGEKSGGLDSAQAAQAFQIADAQTKAAWDSAVGAIGTNDFVTAILTFKKLQEQPNLTPEQRTAVNAAMADANERLGAAMERGEPNSTNALEEIRRRWRSN